MLQSSGSGPICVYEPAAGKVTTGAAATRLPKGRRTGTCAVAGSTVKASVAILAIRNAQRNIFS